MYGETLVINKQTNMNCNKILWLKPLRNELIKKKKQNKYRIHFLINIVLYFDPKEQNNKTHFNQNRWENSFKITEKLQKNIW